MDNSNRLKIKIGPHEFEAEGSPELVQEQFKIFKEMVEKAALAPAPHPQIPTSMAPKPSTIPAHESETAENSLHKIMQFDDSERIVSLTVRPNSAEDAVLLILLGQKWMLSHETVTGGAIMEGIVATGGLQVARVDRLLEKLGRDGYVIVLGERRSKTYRLTNSGVNKAKEIADALIFLV
jgi:hypothetical protein